MKQNYSKITRETGTSRDFVCNMANKLNQTDSLENFSGQGRKRSTSIAEDKYIIALAKRNRSRYSREIAAEVNASWPTSLTS